MENYVSSSFFTKITERKIIFIFLLMIFLICIKDGVIFSPDSDTYINHSIMRIGLYPLIISFFRYTLKGYALQGLIIFQIISIFLTSYCLATSLRFTFKLPFLVYWLIMSAFLSPLLIYKTGNEIMSEGIAYPLFLVSSSFLLSGLFKKDFKPLIYFSFTTFLLCFARQQYVFFYGIALFSLPLLYFLAPNFHKKGLFFLSILLSLGMLFTAERACHYICHNAFSTTPFIGSQLIVRPLFLATPQTYKELKDPIHQQIVKETVEEVIQQKIIPADPRERNQVHYMQTYGSIALIFVNLRAKICPQETFNRGLPLTMGNFTYAKFLDHQTINISLELIKNNPMSYIKSYIKDVMGGFGGHIFFGISLFTTLLCVWNIFKLKTNQFFHLFFIITTLIHLGNLSIICIFEPPLVRYSYSTGLLLFSMFVILSFQHAILQRNLVRNSEKATST